MCKLEYTHSNIIWTLCQVFFTFISSEFLFIMGKYRGKGEIFPVYVTCLDAFDAGWNSSYLFVRRMSTVPLRARTTAIQDTHIVHPLRMPFLIYISNPAYGANGRSPLHIPYNHPQPRRIPDPGLIP